MGAAGLLILGGAWTASVGASTEDGDLSNEPAPADPEAVPPSVDPDWHFVEAAPVSWVASSDRAVVEVRSPGEVTLHGEVWFGPYHTRWTQSEDGPSDGDGEVRQVEVRPPRSAFPHPLAADYVSALAVQVEVGGTRVQLPDAYLAWPAGDGGDAVAWTPAMLPDRAPHGVLRAELRAVLPPDLPAHAVMMPPLEVAPNVAEDTGMGVTP